MAVGKEIRGKIKSVENTKKITKAMEMVAASKMRKAQERMRAARPYSDKIRNIAANLSRPTPSTSRPYMRARTSDAKAVGFIVVTTDKGLCGGLNTNVLRAVTVKMKEVQAPAERSQAVAIGNKGFGFLNRIGASVLSHATQLGDAPQLDKLIGPVKVMLDAFVEGKLDAVYLCYTKFINTMKQEPVVEQLLPLPARRLAQTPGREVRSTAGTTSTSPMRATVIDDLLTRYIEALVFQGVAENMAQRAVGAHGRDEGGHRQRRHADRRAEADLQQDPPGGDHEGTLRDRRRRRC